MQVTELAQALAINILEDECFAPQYRTLVDRIERPCRFDRRTHSMQFKKSLRQGIHAGLRMAGEFVQTNGEY